MRDAPAGSRLQEPVQIRDRGGPEPQAGGGSYRPFFVVNKA